MRKIVTLLTITCLTLPLGGCLLAAAAGGAGTWWATDQYQKSQSKQERAVEKRYQRKMETKLEEERGRAMASQRRFLGDINTRYMEGGLTKLLSIHSTYEKGLVTLYGTVPSPKVAERAIAIASSMKGVQEVRSNLVVLDVELIPRNKIKRIPRPKSGLGSSVITPNNARPSATDNAQTRHKSAPRQPRATAPHAMPAYATPPQGKTPPLGQDRNNTNNHKQTITPLNKKANTAQPKGRHVTKQDTSPTITKRPPPPGRLPSVSKPTPSFPHMSPPKTPPPPASTIAKPKPASSNVSKTKKPPVASRPQEPVLVPPIIKQTH